MLTLLKKLFGKAAPKAAEPTQTPIPLAPSTPMPTVEVAHLSLAAITARFPEELKPLLAGTPEEIATITFPIPTILKQLPTGCVKMSLATLQRQAHGVIKPLPPGDKRVVDVPLAEVFRHIRLSLLKRRPDQRPTIVPESGFNLFGDAANPYAIAPDDHLEQIQVVDLTPVAESLGESATSTAPAGPRVLKMDDGLRQHFEGAAANSNAAPGVDKPSSTRFELTETGPRSVTAAPKPKAAAAPVGKPIGPTLHLKITAVSANWPEEIRQELAALDPATVVTLPMSDIGTGLAKGKVIFSWAQIRAWLRPALSAPTAVAEDTVLPIPLKVVAPAYLSASKKPQGERKGIDFDESIPALFNDSREPEAKPAPQAPAAPVASEAVEGFVVEEEAEEEVANEAQVEEVAVETAPAPEPEPEPAAEPAPAVAVMAHSAPDSPHKVATTVGEVFGQPHKKDWTPAEIVAGTVKLPGVSGAVVALQEGLQVASVLPEGVKSDVVAAFLPQIFARLNQYSGEMKLGEVDDLLFTTHGAHCQIYRLGYVYLAVLGKPGESLPWHELRLISEELARQTHK